MKILFVSLGCDKNLVDTEVMLGLLSEKGYSFTDDEEQADIVVVNTCCFIGDAKEESIQNILSMAKRKESGQLKALIVGGCLAQRYQDEILKEIPEVDAILGTTAIDEIVNTVEKVLENKPENHIEDINRAPVHGKKRIVTTGGHFAYLKIAEGCNKHCTYCIIPKVRGNYRSVPMESLVNEAETLVENGAKELILVAQETTMYGIDLYGKKSLPLLLKELCKIDGLEFIRILYCYPEEMDDELIETIATEKKVCKYLDIPIQHACNRILGRMGRKTSKEELISAIQKLRQRIPEICLRTTLITGFPGETAKEHKELMEFVKEMRFDRLGVFTYSQEEDTPAANMKGQIPEFIKKQRQKQLMKLQQKIAFEKAEETIGIKLSVLIEGALPEEGVYVGRCYKDAPNVDGYVFVNADRSLMTGDFVSVKITGSSQYDLIGEIEDEFTE